MKRNTFPLKPVVALTIFFLAGLFAVQSQAAQPLVSTQWVQDNLAAFSDTGQAKARLIEVSSKGFEEGHIPGAVHMQWGRDTFDPTTDHMVPSLDQMERIMTKLAAPPDAHIVLYDGDGAPHSVARVYWTLKFWNYENVSIMDGGKALWQKEERPRATGRTTVARLDFEVPYPPNTKIRAMYSPDITHALATGEATIIDSRPEPFFKGEVYSLDKWVRNGHITGAVNVPTLAAMNEDKTYKSAEEMKGLYGGTGLASDAKVITYCDTGVLGAHGWFVLSELLGYKNVKLYDGSMREYANRFDTPMEPGIVGGNFPATPIQLAAKNCEAAAKLADK